VDPGRLGAPHPELAGGLTSIVAKARLAALVGSEDHLAKRVGRNERVAGLIGLKGLSLYGATKAGVIQMSKAAALDYATSNIRINVVCPGNTWTSIVFGQDQDPPPPPPGSFVVPGTPMDRWALPAEIAAGILFLSSDEASYATGSVLAIDGGYAIGCPGEVGASK
jgi:NAD(P)-dependent dehydrogenase (short-subunit alcohol dehydrogenase family)